jgi:hypothetical protein
MHGYTVAYHAHPVGIDVVAAHNWQSLDLHFQTLCNRCSRRLPTSCTEQERHCWDDAYGAAGEKYELYDGVFVKIAELHPPPTDEVAVKRWPAEETSARAASAKQPQATTSVVA